MKWKETGGGEDDNPVKSDPYYEDDGYGSLKETGAKDLAITSGNPVRYLYWGLGVAVVAGFVLLLVLIFSNITGPDDLARIDQLEQKIEQLEQRLEKVDGVDEKVTRIWEQAKSFEKFKTRFDRSEASMSLRMDHLAMSLDALQKKTDLTLNKVETLKKAPVPPAAPTSPPAVKKAAAKKTHTVAAGETLFSISRRYNLSVDELRSINKLTDGAVIHVGQTLTVSPPSN
jgi:cell division protein FtsB